MTVAEDASTPAVVRPAAGWTGATLTTAAFTPPSGSLLVILCNVSYSGFFGGTAPTISISGGGLTYTQLSQLADTSRQFNIGGTWYCYLASSPGSITVTATRSSAAAAGGQLAVRVLTGAASTPGLLFSQVVDSTTPSIEASVTPASIGSQIYVKSELDHSSTATVDAATTDIDNFSDGTDGTCITIGKSTALTSSTSAQSYGWTSSFTGSMTGTLVEVVEVTPAVTVVPPTGLTATAVSSSEIDLSWNAVTGATGYDVERNGTLIATGVVGTTYNDTGLSPTTTYTYNVRTDY